MGKWGMNGHAQLCPRTEPAKLQLFGVAHVTPRSGLGKPDERESLASPVKTNQKRGVEHLFSNLPGRNRRKPELIPGNPGSVTAGIYVFAPLASRGNADARTRAAPA
jgi:hypothetical protein